MAAEELRRSWRVGGRRCRGSGPPASRKKSDVAFLRGRGKKIHPRARPDEGGRDGWPNLNKGERKGEGIHPFF